MTQFNNRRGLLAAGPVSPFNCAPPVASDLGAETPEFDLILTDLRTRLGPETRASTGGTFAPNLLANLELETFAGRAKTRSVGTVGDTFGIELDIIDAREIPKLSSFLIRHRRRRSCAPAPCANKRTQFENHVVAWQNCVCSSHQCCVVSGEHDSLRN